MCKRGGSFGVRPFLVRAFEATSKHATLYSHHNAPERNRRENPAPEQQRHHSLNIQIVTLWIVSDRRTKRKSDLGEGRFLKSVEC